MIRRKKMTIFLDAKENTTVLDLKRMIEGITKKPPIEQRLYNKEDAVSICIFTFSFVGNGLNSVEFCPCLTTDEIVKWENHKNSPNSSA